MSETLRHPMALLLATLAFFAVFYLVFSPYRNCLKQQRVVGEYADDEPLSRRAVQHCADSTHW